MSLYRILRIMRALEMAEGTVSEDIAMLRDSSRDGTGRIGAMARAQVIHLEGVRRQLLAALDDAQKLAQADESILWQLVGGVLTWSRVAELLRRDVDEMREQLDLVTALVERYRCTGRVLFRGPEYQTAKRGVQLMDELATAVDRDTAIQAADWSERKVNAMAAAAMEHSTCTS